MKKYIKSTRGNLVYEIERQSFTAKFRTPEDYFTHATRSVWYSTTGFNMFVQYRGAFYMIDRTEAHGYITSSLEFSPVTAEEAAAAKMERAAQAMSEAQEHEAKTAAAALDYDTETAEAEAREARFDADYAAVLAKDAAELAAEAGTSNAASIADITAEYAERARRYADSATETAEQAAAEAEQRAAWMEANPEQAAYIEDEATAHQWSAEETAQEIEYRAAIRTANRAALALLGAYAEAIGEYPEPDDQETAAAYLVARDDLTGTSARASEYDRETVELMTEAIARSARRPDLSKYESVKYLEFDQPEPAPAPTYQRYELEAFLGEPKDYDVSAIEAEATAYDYSTGRTYWTAFGDDLAAIAERHELYQYSAV